MFGIKYESYFVYICLGFISDRKMSIEQINSSKRKFPSDEDQWSTLSREELIQRCKQLDKHVEQLRNAISKTTGKDSKEKRTKAMRPFDFSKHPKRHIFLKFFYLGWDYHVSEQKNNETDENQRPIQYEAEALPSFDRSHRYRFASADDFLRLSRCKNA